MVSPSEDQYKRGKLGSLEGRGEGDVKQGRISQHFYVNVNRDPDRDGEYKSVIISSTSPCYGHVMYVYSCTVVQYIGLLPANLGDERKLGFIKNVSGCAVRDFQWKTENIYIEECVVFLFKWSSTACPGDI